MPDETNYHRPTVGVLVLAGIAGAFLVIFLLFPVLYVFREAFWIKGKFSLDYFEIIFFDNMVLRESISNSIALAVATVLLTTLLSVPLALLTTRYRFAGKRWLSGLLLVPLIMPPFVGAVGIKQLLAQGGSVNILLVQRLGLLREGIDFFGDGGFWAIVGLQVLHLYPIMYLNLSAALANIDPSLEEAARNVGDSGFRLFRKITFPLMLPGYFAGAVLVFVWSFTDLGTPLIFGFRRMVAVQIYDNLQDVQVNRIAYALVVVVVALTTVVFLAGRLYVGRSGYDAMSKGAAAARERPVSRRKCVMVWGMLLLLMGVAWLPHASVFLTSIAGKWFGTVLPSAYTAGYYARVMTHDLAVQSVKNSFMLSLGSVAINLVLGVGIAYILVRRRFAGVGLLDALAMLPLALPGIVIAFGYATCFRGTLLNARNNPFLLLLIAYAVRRLPFMVRAACAGFQQASPALEEAAMNVGASPVRVLFKVTIPLVMANIIAGAVLCFSFAMFEVSSSLLLAFKRPHYPITKAIFELSNYPVEGAFMASAMGMVAMVLLAAALIMASLLLGKKMGRIFRI